MMKSRLLVSILSLSATLLTPVTVTYAQDKNDSILIPKTVQKIELKTGDGKEAKGGDQVVVRYSGWLHDPLGDKEHGALFDSSGNGSFDFVLGAGKVIKGWDQGVVGMKVGGKRTLIIQPELAYGTRGAGNMIPPNSTLIFDIELLQVK